MKERILEILEREIKVNAGEKLHGLAAAADEIEKMIEAERTKLKSDLTELILESAASIQRNLPKSGLFSTSRKNPNIPLVQALKLLGCSDSKINTFYIKALEENK